MRRLRHWYHFRPQSTYRVELKYGECILRVHTETETELYSGRYCARLTEQPASLHSLLSWNNQSCDCQCLKCLTVDDQKDWLPLLRVKYVQPRPKLFITLNQKQEFFLPIYIFKGIDSLVFLSSQYVQDEIMVQQIMRMFL